MLHRIQHNSFKSRAQHRETLFVPKEEPMKWNDLRPNPISGTQFLPRRRSICFLLPLLFLPLLFISNEVLADPPISGGPSSPAYWWSIGDPISVNSGAYSYTLPLLRMGGPLSMGVALSYRTDSSWFGLGVPVGANNPAHFQHNILPAMEAFADGDIIKVSIEPMNPGELIRFNGQSTGGETNWILQGPSPTRYALTKTASGYFWLMDPREGRIYIFGPDSLYGYRILAYQDRNENRWTYVYSKSGLTPARIQDGLGRTLELTFFAAPANDYRKALTRIVDQAGRSINYASVLLRYYTSVTDPMGQTTRFSFDSSDFLTQVQRPRLNTPYRQTYDNITLNGKSQRRTTTQTDAFGNVMTLAYDAAVNKVTTTLPDQTTEVYESYGNNGPIGAITDQTGKKMSFTQTSQGQTGSVTDRLGRTTTYTYHAESGKILSVTNAKGKTINFTYTPQVQPFTNPVQPSETVTFTFYNLTNDTSGYVELIG